MSLFYTSRIEVLSSCDLTRITKEIWGWPYNWTKISPWKQTAIGPPLCLIMGSTILGLGFLKASKRGSYPTDWLCKAAMVLTPAGPFENSNLKKFKIPGFLFLTAPPNLVCLNSTPKGRSMEQWYYLGTKKRNSPVASWVLAVAE